MCAAVVLVLLAGAPPPAVSAEPGPSGQPAAIAWRDWDRSAFDDARREKKLVLLHIAASWSRSGRQMDREAWTDTSVVRVVSGHFVPIRVDADRRPDIADRYLSGGWPTTAVLSTNGQVMASQSVIAAEPLRQMLLRLLDTYRKNRTDIDSRSAESARLVEETWKSEPLGAPEMKLTEWVDRNVAAVREAEDRTNGGLQGAPKQPHFEAARFLFAATGSRRDPALHALALRILDASFNLEDSTWGGFFRIAGDESWGRPRTEKLLDVNARAIAALVIAVEQGGGPRYRDAARRTETWAASWLWTPHPGGWYGSLAADVVTRDGRLLGGDVYYGLSDKARRQQGSPAVDSSLYAEQNARMAAAVLRGSAGGMWKGASTARAVKALDRLWKDQRAPDGSLYHEWRNGRVGLPGRLMDQTAAALAYLEAHAATGEARHLARAESLAVWIRTRLEDPVAGGFRYAPRDPEAIGRLAAGEKPEQGNLEAGWLFLRLWQMKRRPEDLRSAQRALETLRSGDVVVLDPSHAELGLRLGEARASGP